MNRRIAWTLAFLTLAGLQSASAARQTKHWELKGDLSEACSCSVPCTCNFRQGPSPHHFCWAMFALDIQQGHYGNISLNGLHLVGAHANKAVVWYIDKSATATQFAALKKIATDLKYHAYLPQFFERAKITQNVTAKGNYVEVAGRGGFRANYLMGGDGHRPIVVENITAWNLPRATKGRTEYLKYSDDHGNQLSFKGTNSNEGKFDWTDRTARYF